MKVSPPQLPPKMKTPEPPLHSTSLKLVPSKSLGVVSYSPSIVTMAVSLTVYETFSVKVSRDLENWVRDCSRSLKMASFDRWYTSFYWPAIVNIALFCAVFELFDVELYHDLEIYVRGRSIMVIQTGTIRKLACGVLFASIVSIWLYLSSIPIKRDISRKSWFLYPHAFDARACIASRGKNWNKTLLF